jgi:hypothetical protein
MRKDATLIPLLGAMALLAVPVSANTCTAKRLKVKHVCGIVVDASGVPIQGATVHLVSRKDETLTPPMVTQGDGRFSLESTPQGDLFLAISAPQYSSARWPLKITGKTKSGQCPKPLKVHLGPESDWGCVGWVDQK